MQYEECFSLSVKHKIWFSKSLFQTVHLEKGGSSSNQGRLILGSVHQF